MNNIEKLISRIKAEANAECENIEQNSIEECARIRAQYAQTEQDEYWKYLGAGAKETEKRLAQLNELAEQESTKQLQMTKQEMVEAAFALAAEKLRNLPENELNELLAKHGAAAGAAPGELVEKYKEKLKRTVTAALFD